jgi:hypothetical protein
MARYDTDTLAPTPGVGTTVAEFAKLIERNVMINLRAGFPGEVIAWRAPVSAGPKSKPAMVDVKPHFVFAIAINVPEECTDEEKAQGWTVAQENGGWVKKKALPNISNVPVHYPGSSGIQARSELKVGECGWVKISDRSLDRWTQTGGPVDPVFTQFHDLTDAVFEPGLRYGMIARTIRAGVSTIGPEDDSAGLDFDDATKDIALRTTGAKAVIEAATEIDLGEGAVLGNARLNDKTTADTNMTIFIAAVVAQSAVLAGLGFGVAAPAPSDFGFISQASTKVKSI